MEECETKLTPALQFEYEGVNGWESGGKKKGSRSKLSDRRALRWEWEVFEGFRHE